MSIDFTGNRLSYEKDELIEANIPTNPFTLFSEWMAHALAEKVIEPYAMSLATCGMDMKPSVRTVLMREVIELDNNGFSVVFYSNYDSVKGADLSENDNAEVLFFWHTLERQVRITGTIQKISSEKSTEYFHKRPYKSQLAAWASEPQSGIIASRDELEAKFEQLFATYPERSDTSSNVPKPEFWGGYELVATQVEFWQGRASRMHDRIQYTKIDSNNENNDNSWKIVRLMP